VLAVIAIAILVALGPLTWQIFSQKGATLAMPATIGTLQRDDSAGAKETANDLVSALRAEIDLDATTGAIYNDPAAGAGKVIMLFGGTALLWSPEKELDTVISQPRGHRRPDQGSVQSGRRLARWRDEVRRHGRTRRGIIDVGLRLGRPWQHRARALPRAHTVPTPPSSCDSYEPQPLPVNRRGPPG
jgi:hypothetical protein